MLREGTKAITRIVDRATHKGQLIAICQFYYESSLKISIVLSRAVQTVNIFTWSCSLMTYQRSGRFKLINNLSIRHAHVNNSNPFKNNISLSTKIFPQIKLNTLKFLHISNILVHQEKTDK